VIASVRGRLAAVAGTTAVVEVGGVGLALQCTPATMATLRPGEQVALATSLVVREDSLTLFGFVDDDERDVFELVQSVSGVGPRLAQAMLAVHAPDDLRRAVATEDLVALTKVPGIGRKGAQRIVLELKDRIGPPRGSSPVVLPGPRGGAELWREQLHSALLGLGWSPRDAEDAIEAVAPEAAASEGAPDVAALLRAALRALSRA
jgi:Holliday junction DNA helicase RuvA